MARVTKYINSIKRLNQEWGLELKPQITALGIKLLNCEFMPESDYIKHNSSTERIGVLISHSQSERKRKYISSKTSFIDDKGEIFCTYSDQVLHIKSTRLIRNKKSQTKPLPSALSSSRPYFLMSPNALAIAETLMRTPTSQLKEFRSGLKFCQHYNLYQPKFSEIASHLNAFNVEEIAKKIKAIQLDDWLEAFEITSARRFMTPFFLKAEPYYSLLEDNNSESTLELQELFNKYKNQIIPGPSEIAKKMGVLIESNINLWVSPEVISQLKKYKKLVPGQNKDHRTWLIAVADRGFEKEELASHAIQEKERTGDPFENNILRSAWDLTYSDSRTREVRKFLLRRLLNEI